MPWPFVARRFVAGLACAVAVTLALPVVAAQQTPSPEAKRWADIQAPEAWTDIFVEQVVPGAGDVASSVDFARAKHVMFRSSLSAEWVSVVAVPGPGLQTYFLPGGETFIPDNDGMTSFWVASGQLTLARSFKKVPSMAATAITTFLSQVTEQRLVEESRKYSYVSLAAAAPEGFFIRGSQPVSADLRGFDVRDGVLRLALRSHDGRIGSFWVNLSTLYFKAKTAPGDPAVTIARFVAEVDDEALAEKIRRRSSIDLRHAAPFRFFTAGSSGASQPGNLIVTAIHFTDGVLRLDLLSDGGKFQGTFWIDLKAQRLLRSVVDGKEFFKAK